MRLYLPEVDTHLNHEFLSEPNFLKLLFIFPSLRRKMRFDNSNNSEHEKIDDCEKIVYTRISVETKAISHSSVYRVEEYFFHVTFDRFLAIGKSEISRVKVE